MLSFMIMSALAGPCTDADGNGACDITLAPVDALYAPGDSLNLQVDGAPPGTNVYILVTTRGAGTTCDPSNRVCVDLERPIVLDVIPSDAASHAELDVVIPSAVSHGTVVTVQAAWLGGGVGEVSETREVLVNGLPPRIVFQTDDSYQQSFEFATVAEADALCQAEADAGGLVGTYRAWFSDGTDSPSTTFRRNGGPWVRTDGAIVAAGWRDLLLGPRIETQWGVAGAVNGNTLWTGTAADGTAHPDNCNDWNSGNPNIRGMTGSSLAVRNTLWTEWRGRRCSDRTAYLLCFEQR